jgi:uncharacterized protein YjbI with pentapeptide repeats
MGARLRSWWQTISKFLMVVGIIAVLVVAIVLIFVEVRVYGTGFTGKKLWDWLQLLFIPVVLAIAGFWFNHRERKAAELRADNEREIEQKRAKAEQEIASDNQREVALQAYINEMSELLLHENLRESQPEDEVRNIARVRTLTVLPRLDSQRKRNIIQFLYESGLINKDKRIIDLSGADLREVNLSGSRLVGVCLAGANLGKANLKSAYMREANFSGADLIEANLKFAYLGDALMFRVNLREADLNAVNLGGANLDGVSMQGVHMRGAYLNKANLFGCILIGADLRNANLINAEMSSVNLDGANLLGAYLDGANLKYVTGITTEKLEKQTKSLKGATMPDGKIHP